jgi:hypothetical protein
MRVFSYAVARDFGFAPNPFYGYCTLGTCKPVIRRVAKVGDIVLGTGSKALDREGYLIYAMRVTEAMTFNSYWDDPRFQIKKPNLSGSVKKQFGDNIYRKGGNRWEQLDSHHSLRNGSPNPKNIKVDTGTNRVLISDCFSYFGRNAPSIPKRFRNFQGIDICHKRGHKSLFPPKLVEALQDYFETLDRGYLGEPLSW